MNWDPVDETPVPDDADFESVLLILLFWPHWTQAVHSVALHIYALCKKKRGAANRFNCCVPGLNPGSRAADPALEPQ